MMERKIMHYSDKHYYCTVLITATDSSPSMTVLMYGGLLSQLTFSHYKQQ
jgi:hypothetical protein